MKEGVREGVLLRFFRDLVVRLGFIGRGWRF